MINMSELIQRVGAPAFIQVIVEIWNSVFLFIMILSLAFGVRQRKISTGSDRYQAPLTREIMIFFIAVFFYNAFDIAVILIRGLQGRFFTALNYALEFGYFSLGAFQTLLFLQVI